MDPVNEDQTILNYESQPSNDHPAGDRLPYMLFFTFAVVATVVSFTLDNPGITFTIFFSLMALVIPILIQLRRR